MRRFSVPIAAFLSGLAAIAIILAFSGDNAYLTIRAFFARPFSSWWYLGNMLNMAGLLIIAASGAAFSLRGGTFNFGGEAQIYAAALVTALMLSDMGPFSHMSRRFPDVQDFSLIQNLQIVGILASALLAAVLIGAALGFIPGILRARFRVSELLVSFLLSAAVVPILDYLIAGPLRDRTGNLLATKPIFQVFRIAPIVPPSIFNFSFFVALALAILGSLFLSKTAPGYRFCVSGTASEFARFTGYSVETVTVASMTLSGMIHGLTGFFAITGTWYMCHQGLSAGMGWSALAVALIARTSPIAVIPAAILYAWLETASDMAVLFSATGFDSTSIVQGIILLVVSARFLPRLAAKR